MHRYCPEHPDILRRLVRIEQMMYIVIGIALGSGAIQLWQVIP